MKLDIALERAIWANGINVRIRERRPFGDYIARPLEMVAAKNGVYTEPCIVLEITEAQQLMDELWHCGLRPSEGSGSAGSLRATERHLEDMRTLVFKNEKP